MISFVNAKINLGLNILRKRQDGYHDLETVFYPVGLYNGSPLNPESFCDILEIHPYDSFHKDEFKFSDNHIDCPLEKNLVFKAVSAFRNALKEKGTEAGKMCVSLDKHIPDGAGLGGGSADASFTLLSLNSLFDNPFSKEELISLAGRLGADCPFFIENRPVLATGIGEIMRPVDLDLAGYWTLILKPDIYISTKEAFSGIIPSQPEHNLASIISLPPEEWEEAGMKNDFEPHIFSKYPLLVTLKNFLMEQGASYSAMSGSGSSIFGLFPDENSARNAYYRFREAHNSSSLSFLCKL